MRRMSLPDGCFVRMTGSITLFLQDFVDEVEQNFGCGVIRLPEIFIDLGMIRLRRSIDFRG